MKKYLLPQRTQGTHRGKSLFIFALFALFAVNFPLSAANPFSLGQNPKLDGPLNGNGQSITNLAGLQSSYIVNVGDTTGITNTFSGAALNYLTNLSATASNALYNLSVRTNDGRALNFSNLANSFAGNGNGLTNLGGSNVAGTLPISTLPLAGTNATHPGATWADNTSLVVDGSGKLAAAPALHLGTNLLVLARLANGWSNYSTFTHTVFLAYSQPAGPYSMTLGGTNCTNGFFVYAPSSLPFFANGQPGIFSADYGLDVVGCGANDFQIWGDTNLLWHSGNVTNGFAGHVSLSFSNAQVISLLISNVSDCLNNVGDWSLPQIVLTTPAAGITDQIPAAQLSGGWNNALLTNAVNYGNSLQSPGAGGLGSLQLGLGAQANGGDSVAIGDHPHANGLLDSAIGGFALASGGYSTAVGPYATAHNTNTSIGYNANDNGYANTIAIGGGNTANNQVVIGGWNQSIAGNGAGLTNVPGIGSVSSVNIAVPPFLAIAGVPITASGTATISLATESANTLLIGPDSGSPATPTFRTLGSNAVSLSGAAFTNDARVLKFTNTANQFTGTYSGSGSALTGVSDAFALKFFNNLSDVSSAPAALANLGAAQLNGSSGQPFTASTFNGNASGLTNLQAPQLTGALPALNGAALNGVTDASALHFANNLSDVSSASASRGNLGAAALAGSAAQSFSANNLTIAGLLTAPNAYLTNLTTLSTLNFLFPNLNPVLNFDGTTFSLGDANGNTRLGMTAAFTVLKSDNYATSLTISNSGILFVGTNNSASGNYVSGPSNLVTAANMTGSGGVSATITGGGVQFAYAPTPALTNFNSGQRYVNGAGRVLLVSAQYNLTAAATGLAELDLRVEGIQTNACLLNTATAAESTGSVSIIVPVGATYTFTNTSSGAGNSSFVSGGQILTY